MSSFEDFARAHGLLLDHAVADGRWRRARTIDHPRKKNGVYISNGSRGAVRNYALMSEFAVWRENDLPQRGRDALAIIQSMRNQRAKYALARIEAQRLLDESERKTHAYLARKGFRDALGFVHPSGDLLIPMRDIYDYDKLNSVQRISPSGEKKFLAGSKAKGSVFRIGGKGATWLCEGFCTGLSILAGLHDLRAHGAVLVAFSAGNLQAVAQFVRPPAYVAADNDISGAGQKAAEATGLPYCMPHEVGTDFNDMHQKEGLRRVCSLMLDCMNSRD